MKILTFYKLNDSEKNDLKEESPLEKKIKLLSNQNIDLELQIKILKGQKRNAEDKAEKLEKENESLRCDISRYDLNNSALRLRIDKMKNEIEELKGMNESLQCDVSRYDLNNSALRSRIDKMKNEIEELKEMNESLTYNISQCNANNSALRSRIDKMKTENETLKSGINNVNNQNTFEEKISYEVGDKVKLGDYDWTVIETEQSKSLLLCDKFVAMSMLRSKPSGLPATWENSSIRQWLNDEFFNSFSVADRQKIIFTVHEDVNDRIFLLDKSEFIRTKKNIFNINKEWWLRQSGKSSIKYSSVGIFFGLNENRNPSDKKAIRPALYIKNNF